MISAIILAKDEEKNIEACLESVSWCDEVIVIDDNSSDRTAELARKKNAKVITHAMHGNFAAQRNFALSKARGDWVLFVDADERVSSPLWYEIMAETNEANSDIQGYFINRQDIMWGKTLQYGETANIKFLRLARRTVGPWEGNVHEVWKVPGKVITLKNHLNHYPHATVEEFLKEINFYTDLRAKELFDKNVKSYWWSPIVYPIAKFNVNYLWKRGYADGVPGLIFAMLMSFHSFLVRAKLWLLWQKQ